MDEVKQRRAADDRNFMWGLKVKPLSELIYKGRFLTETQEVHQLWLRSDLCRLD